LSFRNGKNYEGKLIRTLAGYGIFSIGLQPDASPDIIVPSLKLGIEVKSTSSDRYYPSKNPVQYEYMLKQFEKDWEGFSAFYLIYFIRDHAWKAFSLHTKSPYKVDEGIPMDKFIPLVLSRAKIISKNMKYKNEVVE
jgi:Holliday junction resolvase